MNKKYYWLKLHDNYFEDENIKIMESMENGTDYILFLFKLKLRSIKNEGYLRVTDAIPYNEKMLATITNTNIDIVRSAMKIFKQFKLVEILPDETIYMKCIESMIGSESEVAKRVRKHRAKKKALQCNKVKQICNTDIDIELDKEKDKDIYNKAKSILLFLNEQTNHKYRPTKGTLKYIKERLNEGYTEKDCRYVIETMTHNWSGTDMERHLDYTTLFRSSNFPKYLEKEKLRKKIKLYDKDGRPTGETIWSDEVYNK